MPTYTFLLSAIERASRPTGGHFMTVLGAEVSIEADDAFEAAETLENDWGRGGLDVVWVPDPESVAALPEDAESGVFLETVDSVVCPPDSPEAIDAAVREGKEPEEEYIHWDDFLASCRA